MSRALASKIKSKMGLIPRIHLLGYEFPATILNRHLLEIHSSKHAYPCTVKKSSLNCLGRKTALANSFA